MEEYTLRDIKLSAMATMKELLHQNFIPVNIYVDNPEQSKSFKKVLNKLNKFFEKDENNEFKRVHF